MSDVIKCPICGTQFIGGVDCPKCNPPKEVGDFKHIVTNSHTNLMELHVRALACHCECLGMNAENLLAACASNAIPYGDDAYLDVMKKWRLVNGKGEPII